MEEFRLEDLPGVGETIAKKLRNAGFRDLMALATTPPQVLAEACEIGEGIARRIINEARKQLRMEFLGADEILEKQKDIKRISTGSKALDTLLGGGIPTQAITEFFGEFGSGKTQVGFQLCVNVQLPENKGGLNGGAFFIDTEGTFRSSRIAEISRAMGLNPIDVLRNIKVARVFSTDHQILITEKIPEIIDNGFNGRLIVVDSLTGLFRAEFIGRGTLADRQQKLNQYVHMLQRYADRYNLAVYVTNQVMARPDILFGDPTAAVGGHVIAHACGYRIYLRKAKENKRVARLVDAPDLPPAEVVFQITSEGIKD
ncbi:MAG: DNA repair and recombination protein RadA [Candidatus Nanoarchaeia archaeon]|nr:DNA repair and recombination protein RadA [Candidatus Haiyanarchaeum thermophilum]MCW1302813.1 DNA repair and recombination protein RadA [Candidatus Haiyanarchaeum thermophilum]MCW1303494.1 DNA repair and recombination protein RadA [Candidatus Haiyanarchaeum thermophilum]MCW1306674.1 DNA repair and recombination protein RadA [Candidatus Haiyanarchaeum thermophilum]MCW1307370.1 DNA repair and recombination protein RadA [Candidatus Haiyanarchaeum thermophilum]